MIFYYKARTPGGKEVTGNIEATDEHSALDELSIKSLFVTKISRGTTGISLQTEIKTFSWVPATVLTTFLMQLAVLIRSGVPLVESLASLETEESNRTFKPIIGDVLHEVEKGRAFSIALSTHPEVFDSFFTGMVHMAEIGGVLDKVLNRLAQIYQRSVTLRSQVLSAIAYPILLILVSTVILMLLFGYALPRFAAIFLGTKMPLPLPTRVLLAISDFTKGNLSYLFIFLAIFIFLTFLAVLSEGGRKIIGEIALRLPIIRNMMQSYLVVHISESLGLLLEAGVPLMELLSAVESTLKMPTASKLLETMRTYVERGSTLRLAMEGNKIFPNMALKLIETGEKTGNLDKMFNEIAGFYNNKLQTSIRTALSILEPLLITIMAGIIGFIVLSIALPIFQMPQFAFR